MGCLHLRVLVLLALCLNLQSFSFGQEKDAENEAVAAEVVTDAGMSHAGFDLKEYEQSIRPILEQSCFDCHSEGNVEGNFRADQLDPDLVGGNDIAWWLEIYSVISKGEMPPPESSELSDADRTKIVDWLSNAIQAAEKARNSSGHHSSFRRLTRYEYNYAMQDLLGAPWEFSGDLPAEASEEDGFENNADSLHMSAKQVEAYQQLASNALQRITVRGEQPPMKHWAIPMKDAFEREKNRLDRDIASQKKKLEDKPTQLAKKIESLNKNFSSSSDKTHYLELSTGLRTAANWNYRKAIYAFKPSDVHQPIPELGSHFAVVQPGRRQDLIVEVGDELPNKGMMRVRIRASRDERVEQRIPSLQLYFGFRATDQGGAVKRLSTRDVQVKANFGHPEVYQWEVPLSEIQHRNTYRGQYKLGDQPNPSEYIRFTNSTIDQDEKETESGAILIDYVEITAPVYNQWPPRSHRSVFIASENSNDETAYAKEIITDFMARAWRGPPTEREIDRKLKLFQRLRPVSSDFQEAVVDVLSTVLTSPKFLYVLPGQQDAQKTQSIDELSQRELATRLSLFLWCSLPDATLLDLASAGRLKNNDVLLQQVDRMLADSRASRFNQHFVEQWLKMQPMQFLSPTNGDDGIDAALLDSMKKEPIELFTDMLENDSSVLDFLDADYLVVNERLAKHYGIPGVQGNQFRRVPLTSDLNRGGLLTQSGLLTMNSNGEDSHPIKRGVWLLTSLLNDPPPPPPAAVPEIDLSDPEILKMTLKERIEDHRNKAACFSCHQKIDPWGIAFENYDARGSWRNKIGEKVVDATSDLPNGSSIDGIKGLKKYLIENRQEQFVTATVKKMASFALGRQLDFGDAAEVRDVVSHVRASGDGIKTMINCLVTSELFQKK